MPPETPSSPETAPQDFNFMMQQQQANTPAAGGGRKFSKAAIILVSAIVTLIVVVVAAMVLGGGGGPSKQVVDLMAQSQEIARVSQAQDQNFQDSNTKGLSATTQASMTSQQVQFAAYLARNHVKYSDKELALKTNTTTDTQLQAAAQNNNLDSAYAQYLKGALTTYENSLSATYNASKSATLKTELQAAYNSVATLLQSPQFKS